jgi:hypothetical protein
MAPGDGFDPGRGTAAGEGNLAAAVLRGNARSRAVLPGL